MKHQATAQHGQRMNIHWEPGKSSGVILRRELSLRDDWEFAVLTVDVLLISRHCNRVKFGKMNCLVK